MIKTVESLHEHLQWALELEHATIPPYLCGLYSLKDGANQESFEVIHSVFIEEMLHMALVANLMLATGGKPKLNYESFIPKYPTYLPHGDKSFVVGLYKFGPKALDTFLKIERPAEIGAKAQEEGFASIGQFYQAIENGIIYLSRELGEDVVFSGDMAHQITGETAYYGGSGHLVSVHSLETALEALREVVEQGEGLEHESVFDGDQNMFHPEREEVAHYFRFLEILKGRSFVHGDTPETGPTGKVFEVDWENVHDMKPNPRSSDFINQPDIHKKLVNFNQEYSDMLRLIERSFNGEPAVLGQAVGVMYELKVLAKELMETAIDDSGLVVGPSFEYLPAKDKLSASILIRKNGPYTVCGSIPLVNKKRITSNQGEPFSWNKLLGIEADETYELCRCGQSSIKPFCDGTHERISFDGTETASIEDISKKQERLNGDGFVVKVDNSFCMHAKFCFNKTSGIRSLIAASKETEVKSNLVAMVERCPSGTFSYEVEINGQFKEVEADLPAEIAVINSDTHQDAAGPLWVTGQIEIQRSDGKPMETRNRVTLCRCGASNNKPFCDGSHSKVMFKGD